MAAPPKNTILVPGIGPVSPDPFVYQVAAQQLDRQLDRYRDVLTLCLGLIAVALAAIAFLVVDKATVLDDICGVILGIGASLAALALFFKSDARGAPDAEALAIGYETAPQLTRARASGAVLLTIKLNQGPLELKLAVAQLAMIIILAATAGGVGAKIVESRGNVNQEASSPDRQYGYLGVEGSPAGLCSASEYCQGSGAAEKSHHPQGRGSHVQGVLWPLAAYCAAFPTERLCEPGASN